MTRALPSRKDTRVSYLRAMVVCVCVWPELPFIYFGGVSRARLEVDLEGIRVR